MDIKKFVTSFWSLDEDKLAKCEGSHQVCIECPVCRYESGSPAVVPVPRLKRAIAPYIDHTLLKPDARTVDIIKLCQEAREYNFASVCVNPYYVRLARGEMDWRTVCTVVGFPLGACTTNIKIAECKEALRDRASEIDMVINIGELKDEGYNYVQAEIEELAEICHEHQALLKVIIETCLLSDDEKVIASLLAKKAGADFVKTSTGFLKDGATVADVRLIRETVGKYMGIKAAGGIRDFDTARALISAGANRIGASASLKIIGVN